MDSANGLSLTRALKRRKITMYTKEHLAHERMQNEPTTLQTERDPAISDGQIP